jgi:hypothetical protein
VGLLKSIQLNKTYKMQIEKISYHKTFNLGNYSNEKIGVDIILSEGENPLDAFAEAKKQVEKSHQFFRDAPAYEKAKKVVENPDDFTGREVKASEEVIKAFEANYPDYLSRFMPASRQLNQSSHSSHGDDDDTGGF